MMHECPTCGRTRSSLPIEIIDRLDALPKPRKEQLALDALIWRYPKIVPHDLMEQSLYDDVGDEIPSSRTATQATIHKLKTKLKSEGWTIKVRRHLGYFLSPSD